MTLCEAGGALMAQRSLQLGECHCDQWCVQGTRFLALERGTWSGSAVEDTENLIEYLQALVKC